MPAPLQVSIQGRVARLTLDRPAHNAFDDALIGELGAELGRLARDAGVRALVLTGNGPSFSAGADANWMKRMAAASEADNQADSERLAALMRTLNFFPKPTIARVNGAAIGGGVGLVACCDIAIAADTAKFALSEVKLGLVPAVISPYVIAAIGPRQARRLFVSAEIIDAHEALRIDLVHRVVAADNLDETIARELDLLAKGAPLAQREAKQLALAMSGMTKARAAATDTENAALIARLRVGAEGQAGLSAFLDKQPPPWIKEP
ncbi:MAG: enoyl-CoA hydratase/isomerase family protein [Proteobacteria bacterium]|uniref:enoyl-CoA hydratase-related protein n=1 Tax=Rudaea sp. TaxID=2136325 RepID=UPI001DA79517|nr:enoyl-CoA hydratase/isomerase family protein [Pseudomonadota bacterium]MBS0568690.1 enoyl-CoA hydratase/isomerase family protein [Pseudomonadota bacterium]